MLMHRMVAFSQSSLCQLVVKKWILFPCFFPHSPSCYSLAHLFPCGKNGLVLFHSYWEWFSGWTPGNISNNCSKLAFSIILSMPLKVLQILTKDLLSWFPALRLNNSRYIYESLKMPDIPTPELFHYCKDLHGCSVNNWR